MGRAGHFEPSAPSKVHPEQPPPYNPGMPPPRPHSPMPRSAHPPPRSPFPPPSPHPGPPPFHHPHPPGPPHHGGPPPGPHHHGPPEVIHESATFSSFNVNLNLGADLPRPASTPIIISTPQPAVKIINPAPVTVVNPAPVTVVNTAPVSVPVYQTAPVSAPAYQPVPRAVYYQPPQPAAPSTVVINAGQGHGNAMIVEQKRSKWFLPCWVHCLISLLFPPWLLVWLCCCICGDGGTRTKTTVLR